MASARDRPRSRLSIRRYSSSPAAARRASGSSSSSSESGSTSKPPLDSPSSCPHLLPVCAAPAEPAPSSSANLCTSSEICPPAADLRAS
eukprot:4556653-Pleurochrysis_carterae.AAC.1